MASRALVASLWLICASGLLSSVASLLFASPASAADEDPFAGIEQMVVIGTSSSALLQSQEVSVVGFDSDYLEALGASDLSDIAQFTPNLEIRTPFAASNPTLFIRGVGLRDFNANSSSSVAVYNDDIYMNSPAGQLAQLFDVGNVDVLRGPQGGIYGRNASAGAIRVISRKPTGTPGGYLNTTYGRFQQLEIEGAVEAPIVPDMLSIRVSGRMNKRGGTTKNRCADPAFATRDPNATPQTSFQRAVHEACFRPGSLGVPELDGKPWTIGVGAPVKERVNDTNNWAMRSLIRLQLDWADGVDILFNVHGGQNRGDARQFQMIAARQEARDIAPRIDAGLTGDQLNAVGQFDINRYRDPDNAFPLIGSGKVVRDPFIGRPFEGDYNKVEQEKLDLFGGSVVAEVQTGNWTVKTIVGYEWNRRDVGLNLDGSPDVGLEVDLRNKSYQTTGELRVGWDEGEGFSFQIAGMFLYEYLEVDNRFLLVAALDTRLQEYTFRTRYGSVYGELEWEPSETLSVKAGARFNWEQKEIRSVGQPIVPFTIFFSQGSGVDGIREADRFAEDSLAEEFGWAGDLTLSYLPTNDVTFYGKYARGWKGPHINGLVTSRARPADGTSFLDPVKPETVDSLEFGIKSLWWEGRVKVNGAFFIYDYNNLQVFRLRNTSGGAPSNQLINARDASIVGVEFDVDLRPFEGLGPPILDGFNVFASFAWLDSSYTDFLNENRQPFATGGQTIIRTTTIDFSGQQLVNSPEFSFVGFAQWLLPTDYGTLVPRFDWSFKDDIFFSPENSELVGQTALWLLNFRLTYKSPTENFEIAGYVENMTDQAYTVDVFNLARFRNSILYAIGDPRTYGVTLRVKF